MTIVDTARAVGIEAIQRTHESWVADCPWCHGWRTFHLTVRARDGFQSFNCFGCGAAGQEAKLIERMGEAQCQIH